jgi:DNA (cytosine-5)-methyltransferase 1
VRPNEKGGTGALWYIDKTFTIASTQDQFIATVYPIISPAITTCKGSRGGCSDEAIEEIKAVHEARQQQPFITKPQPMTTQPLTPQVPLRFLSVCSGMEAASVAWEPLGWKAVGFSEIEPFPCAVLAHRFPNTPNYGSLTEYQSWPLEPGSIDLLVGGTPCQSFSVAGLRKGLADPRGNLALVFLGLADKLKPRWIVWENVPGVLSSDGGRDFGSFLGALEQLGYGWAYRVLDAQYFGVPQRRRRVFVVASLGGRDVAASVLLEPESVCWNPAPRRKKGQATAADAGAGVEAGLPRTVGTPCADAHPGAYSGQDAYTGRLIPSHWEGGDVHPTLNQAHNIGSPGYSNQELFSQKGAGLVPVPFRKSKRACSKTAPTLQSFMGTGGCNVPMVQPAMAVRRLTPTECERLQGFPDNWSQIPWKGKPADQCPDGPRYKCAGNSMAVPVMRWIGEQIARVEAQTK